MQRVVTESSASEGACEAMARDRTGLVVCAWREAAQRVGEWIVPDLGRAPTRIFGRAEPGQPERLPLWRWRPDGLQPAAPVLSSRISAEQLEITPRGRALHLRRLGRRELRVRGQRADEAIVEPGDLVELVNEVLFVVAVRPEPQGREVATHAFGQPDEDGIIGESPAIWELRRTLRAVASLDVHTLVRGPSGSGKELVARAIHRLSRRRGGPFVARNAATIPDTLVDAELFGHVAGYPTSGMPERPGLVGAAHRGLLFLDEVGDLPLVVQPHLLRLLDQGEYHRLGDARARRSDLRLIGATNRPAEDLRADLGARFLARLELPGLDQRREDIVPLAVGLLRRAAERDPWLAERFFEGGPGGWPRLSYPLQRSLVLRTYRAHARELLALLLASATHSPGAELEAPTVEVRPASPGPVTPVVPVEAAPVAAPPVERGLSPSRILRVLEECNGVQELAWRQLGLDSRHQLARLIRRHGLAVTRRPSG